MRIVTDSIRDLMVHAIDTPSGTAYGVLTGDVARAIANRFNTPDPILIDITTEYRFEQPGCSRLNLKFSQGGIILPGTSDSQHKTVDMGLNYCRDGMPPRPATPLRH